VHDFLTGKSKRRAKMREVVSSSGPACASVNR
jgi:hypothetical protein